MHYAGYIYVKTTSFLLSSLYRGYSCVSSSRSCSRDKNLQLEDPIRS